MTGFETLTESYFANVIAGVSIINATSSVKILFIMCFLFLVNLYVLFIRRIWLAFGCKVIKKMVRKIKKW